MGPLTEEEKQERPFTVEEVAEYLKIHPNTILKWIKAGRVKASKVGREWRIKRSEVDRLIDEGETN